MQTARRLIDLSNQLNIRLVGVAFHVGCSNSNPSFDEEIEKCRVLFDYARENYSIEMSIVDLGGGNCIFLLVFFSHKNYYRSFFVGFPGVDEDNDIFFQTSQVINESNVYDYNPFKKQFHSCWEFLG